MPSNLFDSLTNPPVYIDSVTYGSIMIFAVNYDEITSKLYGKLDGLSSAQAKPILN